MTLNSLFQMLLKPRVAFALALLACAVSLATALTAQFGFALKPCILCLYQRIPFALMLLVGLPSWFLLPKNGRGEQALLLLFMVIFAGSAALALFNIGVEEKWWTFGAGCPVVKLEGKSDAEALTALLTMPQSDCAEPAFRLFGLSFAGMNFLMSSAFVAYLVLTLLSAARAKS